MAVRAILDVNIDDRRFLSLKKLTDEYRETLEKAVPKAWSEINKRIAETNQKFERLVQQAGEVGPEGSLFAKAMEAADKHTANVATKFAAVEVAGKKVATHIREMTKNFINWTGLGFFKGPGGMLALLGAGLGLTLGTTFGFDRFSAGVSARRQEALGLGTTPGAAMGVESALGRFVGPDFLHQVAAGRLGLQSRLGLIGAGLTPAEMAGDTATTAVALLRRLKQIADSTNPLLYEQVIQARRLPTTPEQLQLLQRTQPEEFERQIALQKRWADQLEKLVSPEATRKYQDLTSYLDFAGKKIWAVFVQGLAPLAGENGPIAKLSQAFSDVVKEFMEAASKNDWITKLANTLEDFGKTIANGDFLSSVKGFVDGVTKIGTAIKTVTDLMPDMGAQAENPLLSIPLGGGSKLQIGRPQGWAATAAGVTSGIRGVLPGALPNTFDERYAEEALHHPVTDTVVRNFIGYRLRRAAQVAANGGQPFVPAEDVPLPRPRPSGIDQSAYMQGPHPLGGYAPAVVRIENQTGGNNVISVNGLVQ